MDERNELWMELSNQNYTRGLRSPQLVGQWLQRQLSQRPWVPKTIATLSHDKMETHKPQPKDKTE